MKGKIWVTDSLNKGLLCNLSLAGNACAFLHENLNKSRQEQSYSPGTGTEYRQSARPAARDDQYHESRANKAGQSSLKRVQRSSSSDRHHEKRVKREESPLPYYTSNGGYSPEHLLHSRYPDAYSRQHGSSHEYDKRRSASPNNQRKRVDYTEIYGREVNAINAYSAHDASGKARKRWDPDTKQLVVDDTRPQEAGERGLQNGHRRDQGYYSNGSRLDDRLDYDAPRMENQRSTSSNGSRTSTSHPNGSALSVSKKSPSNPQHRETPPKGPRAERSLQDARDMPKSGGKRARNDSHSGSASLLDRVTPSSAGAAQRESRRRDLPDESRESSESCEEIEDLLLARRKVYGEEITPRSGSELGSRETMAIEAKAKTSEAQIPLGPKGWKATSPVETKRDVAVKANGLSGEEKAGDLGPAKPKEDADSAEAFLKSLLYSKKPAPAASTSLVEHAQEVKVETSVDQTATTATRANGDGTTRTNGTSEAVEEPEPGELAEEGELVQDDDPRLRNNAEGMPAKETRDAEMHDWQKGGAEQTHSRSDSGHYSRSSPVLSTAGRDRPHSGKRMSHSNDSAFARSVRNEDDVFTAHRSRSPQGLDMLGKSRLRNSKEAQALCDALNAFRESQGLFLFGRKHLGKFVDLLSLTEDPTKAVLAEMERALHDVEQRTRRASR